MDTTISRKKARSGNDKAGLDTAAIASPPPPPPNDDTRVRCYIVAKDGGRVPLTQPVVNMLSTIKSALDGSSSSTTTTTTDIEEVEAEEVPVGLVESAATLQLVVDFCENFVRHAGDEKARKKWQNDMFGANGSQKDMLIPVLVAANILGMDVRPIREDVKDGAKAKNVNANDVDDNDDKAYPLNELADRIGRRIMSRTAKQIFTELGDQTSLTKDEVNARVKEAYSNPAVKAITDKYFPKMNEQPVA